jgi:hypothetical protein
MGIRPQPADLKHERSFSMHRSTTRILLLTAILAVTLPAATAAADRAGKRSSDRYGDDLKRTTVILKHADGHALERLLNPYLTKRGRVHFESRTRALTLVDEPAVVDIMLKMVDRFDVKPPQLRFTLQLVLAEDAPRAGPVPKEIRPVARQLKEVFSYNKYTVMDKTYLAVEANQDSSMRLGGEKNYTVEMETHMVQGERKAVRIEFHLYRLDRIKHIEKGWKSIQTTLVRTTVEMKDGETAILGASKINGEGKALITILGVHVEA